MWQDFLFCANMVFPIFEMILLGWLSVRFRLVDRPFMAKLSRLTFRWSLSVMMFLNVAKTDFSSFSDLSMPLYCCAVTVAVFLATWALAKKWMARQESVGAFVHVCFRGAITTFGVPMLNNLAGAQGVARAAVVSALCTVLYTALAVLCLTRRDGGRLSSRRAVVSFVKKLVTNPLLIAVSLGVLASYFRISLPTLVYKPLSYLADLAVPLSLLSIGAALDLSKLRGGMKYPLLAALIKTVLMGALGIPLAVALGFRGVDLAAIGIMLTLCNPTACYIMTEAMDGDGALAAEATVLSTLLSVVSVTLTLFLLKACGLL